MNGLDFINLKPLMRLIAAQPVNLMGLIDGPVAFDHLHFASARIRVIPGKMSENFTMANSELVLLASMWPAIFLSQNKEKVLALSEKRGDTSS
ncbi:MAG: hypothetical protein R3293_27385 [Candidatus Promineifilaceae bacterium]|nr:hypothetical protein [Candidatus Promineifilaceae bacterium]